VTNAGDVSHRLADVRARIAAAAERAGRDPSAVTLVAVSKGQPAAAIEAAVAAGQRDFGENRAQELVEHARAVAGTPDLRWHFVGRLQRNKVKAIAPLVACWQSIDRIEVGRLVAEHAPGARVLVQVNVGAEPQKGGCAVGAAPELVARLREGGLVVAGLMAVPPLGEDPRPYFDTLRALGAQLVLDELSMGMTSDFEVAVEAGATIVRVGTAVFGERPGRVP
jgi:pyridoxal phosphate enzyme (YggS family)